MVHDINTGDYCAFSVFALLFGRSISVNERVTDATLCSTDHLAHHLQTLLACALPHLVDVRECLITADEVPVDDHNGGW